jgi:hypothetical protein
MVRAGQAVASSATVINVIQISPPDADHDNLLVKLAKHSGGEHVYVDFNNKPVAEK